VEKCTVYGKWEDPSTWKILLEGHTFNGAFASEYFIRDYASYEECRKWVLKEIQERRKVLGRNMNEWLQKKKGVLLNCSR